jgi:alcohol dehydrogenase
MLKIFKTTAKIIFGNGAVRAVGEEAKAIRANKALIVTDPGILNAGLSKTLEESLSDSGIDYGIFGDVEADPRIDVVKNCVETAKKEGSDLLIALGGGSSIDTAKVTSILITNKGRIEDYFGADLITKRGIPNFAIPSTSGSGSEVTPIAILSDETEKLKKGIVSSHLFPSVAVLDPELALSLPAELTASTGMDALIHAIEAYTSVNATGMTDMLAIRAMELLYGNIRTAYANGRNLEARSRMMEGSLLAGMAFANAGVTAVHAFAYPIGAEFHIPHGVANTLMLSHVLSFNLLGNVSKFANIANIFGFGTEGIDDLSSAEIALEAVERLVDDLQLPKHLSDFGVVENDIQALAESVMKVTRILANNPRVISVEDAMEIYRAAL